MLRVTHAAGAFASLQAAFCHGEIILHRPAVQRLKPPVRTAVRLEHPMLVSTYSRQFHAEHDSINAGQVGAFSP